MSVTHEILNELTAVSTFSTAAGAEEVFLKIDAGDQLTFAQEIDSLLGQYQHAAERLGLSGKTLVFSRLFLSDLANQKEPALRSGLYASLREGAVSLIEQRPVEHGALSLLAFHIRPSGKELRKQVLAGAEEGTNGVLVGGDSYDMLWTAGVAGFGLPDPACQTGEVFHAWSSILADHGMSLADHAVRTWVYVRDIDQNYAGMVQARRDYFEANGLTRLTRYLASTGIEGISREAGSLVTLDALAMRPLAPDQIVRMEALDHMSPTIHYGVTFERGCRIRFGDRSHLHVSGTASIDKEGRTLYPGDPRRQAERAIANIRALLAPHGATLNDMAYLAAYLRDPKDRDRVAAVLAAEIPPTVPLLFLESKVCRPNWLIELDGLAIIEDRTDYPAFC